MNPWRQVPLSVYEGHMELDNVAQLQALDTLYAERLRAYPARRVAFWGIAGGNGLRHIQSALCDAVYGVDINEAYLSACRGRYPELAEKLTLIAADLSQPVELPYAELIFADLLIEYIGIPAFIARTAACRPRFLCCTIQQNLAEAFVSPSPYAEALAGVGSLHTDVAEDALTKSLSDIGYLLMQRGVIPLVNGKQFVRLDYTGDVVLSWKGRSTPT